MTDDHTVNMDEYHDYSPLDGLVDAGYVHVYTGMGKGKTTAALGLAFRAAGYGLKTYVGQFMKGIRYGEYLHSRNLDWIVIERYGEDTMVHPDAPGEDDERRAEDGMKKLCEAMASGDFQIVVADELITTCAFGILPWKSAYELIETRKPGVELILTGIEANDEILKRADLVTLMNEEKHYYKTKGVLSRKGIDR